MYVPLRSLGSASVGTYVQGPALGQLNSRIEDRLFRVRGDLDRLRASLDLIPEDLQQEIAVVAVDRWKSCEEVYQAAKTAPDPEKVALAETCVANLKIVIQSTIKDVRAPGGSPKMGQEVTDQTVDNGREVGKTPESDATRIAAIVGVSVFAAVLLYAISSS